MKRIVKRLVPHRVRMRVRRLRQGRELRKEFVTDAERFAVAAPLAEGAGSGLTPVQLEAQLTRDYHRVEKGLALGDPKRPFGAEVAARIDSLLPEAQIRANGSAYVEAAASARLALENWNEEGVIDARLAPALEDQGSGLEEPDRFFASRHSVRHFSRERVDAGLVAEAVRLAAFSPSVCNRQPWKVRLYAGDDVTRLLRHQNGNRGFTDEIPTLALVSVELGHFAGAGERNQAWIEGGIFSSTLVWALHGVGLESCMLNLSVTNAAAEALRRESGMPQSEVPIMMIAVGHGAEGRRVARSPRREVSELLDVDRSPVLVG